MKIMNLKNTGEKEIIDQTIEVLKNGGLVVFPTETTYGAGVDATNPEAVGKLLAYKSRREGKPLSIAVSDKKMASEYVFINSQANALIEQFLPGPVTVVCKVLEKTHDRSVAQTNQDSTRNSNLAPGVASEFGTLGIRIPNYKLILDLVSQYKKPITATSANASGKKRPYCINDILKNLSEKQKNLIDLVLDAGELPHNEPSTIIDTTLSAPITLRGKLSNIDSSSVGGNKNIGITTRLISSSEQETKEIAGRLLLKNWNEVGGNGIIFALDGSLGTGKTIFTKGIAEFLKITETVKSPTYSYIEEYDFKRHQTSGKFYHLDMWKVEDKDMYERLEVEKLFGKNNIIVIEWFDQIKNFINPELDNVKVIRVLIEQSKDERILEISDNAK
jgi:L-threonylcarbamoyladenylate synthase